MTGSQSARRHDFGCACERLIERLNDCGQLPSPRGLDSRRPDT
jgi:hypothetical protein